MNDNTRTLYTLTFPMPECREATVTKEFDSWEERSRFMRSVPTAPITTSMRRIPMPEQQCMLPQCPGQYLMLLQPVGCLQYAALHLA